MSQADIHNFNILVLAMHFLNFEQFQSTARVTFLEMTVKIQNMAWTHAINNFSNGGY